MFSPAFFLRGPRLEFVGNSGSNTTGATTPWPVGVLADDVAVFCAFMFDGAGAGVPSRSTPSGWSVITDSSGGVDYGGDSVSSVVYIKKVTLADIGAELPTVNASYQHCTDLLVFRPVGSYTSWDATGWSQSTAQVPLTGSIIASGQTVPCVAIAYGGKRYSGGNSMTFTPAGTSFIKENGASTARTTVTYSIFDSSPADITTGYDIDRLTQGVVRMTGA